MLEDYHQYQSSHVSIHCFLATVPYTVSSVPSMGIDGKDDSSCQWKGMKPLMTSLLSVSKGGWHWNIATRKMPMSKPWELARYVHRQFLFAFLIQRIIRRLLVKFEFSGKRSFSVGRANRRVHSRKHFDRNSLMSENSTQGRSTSQRRSARRSLSNSTIARVFTPTHRRSAIQNSLKALSLTPKGTRASQGGAGVIARDLTQSQPSTTPNPVRSSISFVNVGEGESEQASVLNTSTTSAATEDMDTNPHQDNGDGSGQVNADVTVTKGSIGKSQLIEEFFTRLDTGGFLCKLCRGSAHEQKVSIFGFAQHFVRIRFMSIESSIPIRMSFARMKRQTCVVWLFIGKWEVQRSPVGEWFWTMID